MNGLLERLLSAGGPRLHAAVALLAAVTLCAALLVLVVAAALGRALAADLGLVAGSVAGLAGFTYAKGSGSTEVPS